jgi:hypothetical protein
MATSFPSSLDSFTNPSASDALDSVSVPHADQHADLNDAMEAVQTKLGTGAGTIGTWTTFTPVFTNFTLGNGTVDAVYCHINDLVFVEVRLTFGSTSSLTGGFTINNPVGTANGGPSWRGSARLKDNSPITYVAGFIQASGTQAYCYKQNVSGSNIVAFGLSGTYPWTWATGDTIDLEYWYRKA